MMKKRLSFLLLFLSILRSACSQTELELVEKVELYQYSSNISDPVLITNSSPVLNPSEQIKIIIHGYIARNDHISVIPLINAYLSIGYNNIISVDWRDLAATFYPITRLYVKNVGYKVCELLKPILEKNPAISLDNVHVIGHSLGAHIAGNVGKCFQGKLGRVTALDPAMPAFQSGDTDTVRYSDAKFVDSVHTNPGGLGQFTNSGDADFYFNEGTIQPGCDLLDVITLLSCSHFRAPIFYAESIISPESFPSIPCLLSTIKTAPKNCQSSEDVNYRNVTFMGEKLTPSARGVFHVETNSVPPYGKGKHSFMRN